MVRRILLPITAVIASVLITGTASATLTVDPPQQITKQVTVQLIQSALNNGTSPATVFGDASQRALIEAGIDSIWAQAGIDINFLPTINHYNNTLAYQGNPLDYDGIGDDGKRPSGDFSMILANAGSAGVLSTDPLQLTLNLILVNVVPSFAPFDENSSAGFAQIGANGITGYVGDNLLTFGNGRDVIASVMAHEIGHNLNLNHTGSGTANLMSSSGGTSQQLTSSQIATARSSNFARLFTPTLIGDYNGNGKVDAADYVVWRNTLNQSGTGLPADGNNSGGIDTGDYTVWKSHFGATGGTGSLLEGDGAGVSPDGIGAVPEANSITCLLIALPLLWAKRRTRRSRGPVAVARAT